MSGNDNRGPWGGGHNDDHGSGQQQGSGGGNHPWGQGNPNDPDGFQNFDETLRNIGNRLRTILPGGQNSSASSVVIGIIIIVWLAFTCFYRVDANEVGVVKRLGAYHRQQNPGLNVKMPWPIEVAVKVPVTEENLIEIGSSDIENLVLTGDQNIITIAFSVRWRIKPGEAFNFIFSLANPQMTIREVAESAMREAISRSVMTDAIGPERARIADQVKRRIQEILDSYRAGILISAVQFKQVDPPSAVDAAFKDVSAAQQEASTLKNQAEADRQQLIAQAQGEAARFNALYQQYRLSPRVTRKRMYLETMEQVLSPMDKIILEKNSAVPYLPLDKLVNRNNMDGG